MELRERLKALRKENGLIPEDIGFIFGKSESAVRAWENGRTKPDVDTLILMSISFGCTTDYLLGLSDCR